MPCPTISGSHKNTTVIALGIAYEGSAILWQLLYGKGALIIPLYRVVVVPSGIGHSKALYAVFKEPATNNNPIARYIITHQSAIVLGDIFLGFSLSGVILSSPFPPIRLKAVLKMANSQYF
jgi:hypothetical protein